MREMVSMIGLTLGAGEEGELTGGRYVTPASNQKRPVTGYDIGLAIDKLYLP